MCHPLSRQYGSKLELTKTARAPQKPKHHMPDHHKLKFFCKIHWTLHPGWRITFAPISYDILVTVLCTIKPLIGA